jgi:N-acetylglucosamine kinase-like BadF-type ATPase
VNYVQNQIKNFLIKEWMNEWTNEREWTDKGIGELTKRVSDKWNKGRKEEYEILNEIMKETTENERVREWMSDRIKE